MKSDLRAMASVYGGARKPTGRFCSNAHRALSEAGARRRAKGVLWLNKTLRSRLEGRQEGRLVGWEKSR